MKKNKLFLILFLLSSCYSEDFNKLEEHRRAIDSIDKKIKVLEEQVKLEKDSIYKSIINNDH
jgi:hypothetical protein